MFKQVKNLINDAKLHYGIGLNMAVDNFNHNLNSLFIDRKFFDDEFFEELEEKLIELDIMPLLAVILTSEIEKKIYNKHVNKETFNEAMYEVIINVVKFKEDNELKLEKDRLNILLIVGINGVGKTTTISKLANKYKSLNLELVAADTFRAGAIKQLNEWATRLNVPITKTHQGHTPSAVIYDGIESAKNNKRELLICDTAGRLHNKDELMNELKKIHTVIEKNTDEDTSIQSILVLDGTAGKNTIDQAIAFNKITKLDGVIVTKMDSNAKVGMLINISYELDVPIYFITNGEQIEDIKVFDRNLYLSMLFGQ